jgi:hypothetical protein
MIVVQVGLSQGAILLRDFPLGTSAAVMKLIAFEWKMYLFL